jgi:hypothetical protein
VAVAARLQRLALALAVVAGRYWPGLGGDSCYGSCPSCSGLGHWAIAAFRAHAAARLLGQGLALLRACEMGATPGTTR